MDKEKELEYILAFATERDFAADVEREQLRALWTAYCLHWNLDCDTSAYDKDIATVWERVLDGVSAHEGPDVFYDDETFDLYMGEYLS